MTTAGIRHMKLSDASAASDTPDAACGYVACILINAEPPTEVSAASTLRERLLACCRETAARVEPVALGDAWGALLDLGRCTADEARAACSTLHARLARRGFDAGIGVGPTLTLARLAALTPSSEAVRLIAPSGRATFLYGLPVELLTRLEPLSVTPEMVERLRRYGLRTLGQVARLAERDAQTLPRQFGRAGAAIALLARGDDVRALQPAPAPEQITVRRRFSPSATADQALASVPALAARLARLLGARSQQGRDLCLRITWESGSVSNVRRRLARPHAQASELAQAACALLAPQLAGGDANTQVASLTLTLGDLSTRLPAQPAALFHLAPHSAEQATRERRTHAQERIERIAAEVAGPLARRYGAPALYRLSACQPDAILPEDRLRLVSLIQPRAELRAEPRAEPRRVRRPKPETASATAPQPHWW